LALHVLEVIEIMAAGQGRAIPVTTTLDRPAAVPLTSL
jgi:hypothetical protein